jgi:DNA-binding NarL/FixJ family response regulator
MPVPRVLLADDHAIVAEGLQLLLKDRCELVGIVVDGPSLVEAAVELCPDIIVADISMPGFDGLEAMRQLIERGVPSKVIVLTMYSDPQLAREALAVGAKGYVLKHAAGEELLTAIRDVSNGLTYITPLIRDRAEAPPADGIADHRALKLTPRQRDVLRLIAEGLRMKEIAEQLGVSPRTVETHKYEMMQALGAHSTADLVRYALRSGVVRF